MVDLSKMSSESWKLSSSMLRRLWITCALLVIHSPASIANGETQYRAILDASQVLNNVSNSTATGTAQFSLNDAGTHLSYSLRLAGLDLVLAGL